VTGATRKILVVDDSPIMRRLFEAVLRSSPGLDIDHFKNINDTYGHPAGDAGLVHMANLIGLSVRSTDVVARYGGEEFGILLIQAGGAEASIITNRIRERIVAHKFTLPGQSGEMVQVPVTVSIGVTQFNFEDSLQSFLERADRALYQAKQQGRNRFVVFTGK